MSVLETKAGEKMKKVYLIQYKNPKGNIVYCLNEWAGNQIMELRQWWERYESKDGYIIKEILYINNQEEAEKYLKNHKSIHIIYTQKNHKWLNDITNNKFDEIMFQKDYTHNFNYKVV